MQTGRRQWIECEAKAQGARSMEMMKVIVMMMTTTKMKTTPIIGDRNRVPQAA